jgi:putative phosphoribosyl transferase
MAPAPATPRRDVRIDPPGLFAYLDVPGAAKGLVLFAHGSGSGRKSPRNGYVAGKLQDAGIATLLLDLLTPEEEHDRRKVFDIPLLAARLVAATEWIEDQPSTRGLPIGYFGASTGAGAALMGAAARPDDIDAVVSRGGRPDLAGEALTLVRAPTLLIVGSLDIPVIELNKEAKSHLRTRADLVTVPGASHLFEEPGTLDRVIVLARDWFLTWFAEAVPEARDDRPQTDLR